MIDKTDIGIEILNALYDGDLDRVATVGAFAPFV